MKRRLLFLLCGIVAAGGCDRCSDKPDPPGDDDTEIVGDDDAGDDDATEISGTLPPLPAPTPIADPLTEVKVWPMSATIDLSSSMTFVAEASLASGASADMAGLIWEVVDASVAQIASDGTVTPVGVGSTTVTATLEEVTSEPAVLEIVSGDSLYVRVVDAETDEPIPEAEVYLGAESVQTFVTDGDGAVTIEIQGDVTGPQTVTAYHPDYYHATILNTISRKLVVPLRSQSSTTEGSFSGVTDFSLMESRSMSDIRLGLITRSFYGNPLSLDTSTIIGSFRTEEVCGYDMFLPTNVVGEASCGVKIEILDYAVPGPTGTYDAYMLAGDLPLATLFQWLDDDPDIFTNLGVMLMQIPNMYEFGYSYLEDISIEAPDDTSDITVAPSGQTSGAMVIDLPLVPSGIDPSYPPAVFVIADVGERGYLPIGVGGADGGTSTVVYYPPEFEDRPLYGMVLASEEGIGNEGAYAAVMGQRESETGSVAPEPFLELIQYDEFSVAEQTYTFFPVEHTSVYRTVFTFQFKFIANTSIRNTLYWDVYQPKDLFTTTLPAVPSAPWLQYPEREWEMYRVNWEFFAYDNGTLTFDVFTMDPSLDVYDSSILLERISRNKIYDVEEF